MPGPGSPARVLQLLGDTRTSLANLSALDLHHRLAGAGREVRTLALAPGRGGGLEQDVPTLAPVRRSLAAANQVSNETRWSDLVVLHGERALTLATSPGRMSGTPPVVVALWAPLTGAGFRWSVAARILRSARVVVVPDQLVADSVTEREDVGVKLEIIPVVDDPPHTDGPAWSALLDSVMSSDSRSGRLS